MACFRLGTGDRSVNGLIFHLNEGKDQPMRKKIKIKSFANIAENGNDAVQYDKVIAAAAYTKDNIEDLEVCLSGPQGIVIGCLDRAGEFSLWRSDRIASEGRCGAFIYTYIHIYIYIYTIP